MTIKIQKQVLEGDFGNGICLNESIIKDRVNKLLRHKISGLSNGVMIPDDLISEAESFMKRNLKKEMNNQFCPRCLKAHVIKKAKETLLSEKEIKFLNNVLEDELGHNGYYMDEDELVEI